MSDESYEKTERIALGKTKEPPTRSEIWQTFRGVNLTEYHETKNNLTYVPWARAWSCAMNAFGDHLSVKWHGSTDKDGVVFDHIRYPDNTASVCCSAIVGGEKYAECTLAVMDYRNAAVENPTSVDFQNSRQRCQTKLLAMLGLGLYLWENDGTWDETRSPDSGSKAKTPKKATAKVKKKPAETPPDPVETVEEKPKQNIDAVRTRLSERCKELYANNWEADEALQNRIKGAVKSGDVSEMESLLKLLDDAMPGLLALHKE
tara:strand:+ start:1716 stop:2498 length:783 start_codon:yes stop_codon:yes gene_type:complete